MAEILSADAQGIEQGTGMIRSSLEKNGIRKKISIIIVPAAEEIKMDLFQYPDKALSRSKKMTPAGFRSASVIFHLHVPVFDWKVSCVHSSESPRMAASLFSFAGM